MFSLLYVDDEPALLEIGKLFLEQGGLFSVDTVTSAPDALLAITKKGYDAIISDYQMPGMDGIEFLKRVRASGNTVPFIIFTGRGREEIVIQALNEGADFYLQKGGEPVSQFAELEHKVQVAVMQRRAEASIRDHERREADIMNFLPDATFAIDTNGIVIAWNRAMEKMTGVKSSEILGKDSYEYAIPFYHERRPILIDLVLKDDPITAGKYPAITRDGRVLYSEITIPHFNGGRGAALWFTASPLYDNRSTIVGAIESIREITERKQAEEALNESERRFRELSDLLPQVVYETDENGILKYANRIAFEMFGYTEENLKKGVNVLTMIAPDDQERAARAFHQMIEDGSRQVGSEEYKALRKDGSTFPISIYSSPVLQGSRITGLRGIIVDITESKLAEEKVRESEQNYRFLFENATEGILIAQGDHLVLINSALINLLGRPAEAITSRPFTDFIHPDDREIVMSRHLQRMRGETPFTGYMFRIITGEGLEKWVWINSTRITWSGKPASLSFLTDMTERKTAEQDLVAANKEYVNLLNQIQDVYYRSDAEGRMIKASQSLATLLGYDDISECLGKNIADEFYLNPADRKQFLEEINRKGKVTDYEVLLKKKDGTPVLISTSSHLNIDATGKVLGVEGTFRDITERKRQDHILHTQLDLGLKLQKVHGMHDTLKACLCSAIEIAGMDSGGVYLVDEHSGSIDLVLSQNLMDTFIATVTHYSPDSPNAQIVMAGKPLYLPFSKTGVVHTPVQEEEGLQAVAILPIVSGSRTIACLNISSHTRSDIPTNSRVALETIATQIGTAIERIRADEALARSEQKYRNVVEDQTEFISRFLPDGTHVFVNEAYCRYFGMEREEILGHRFKPKIPAEDQERVKRFFLSLTPDHPVDIIEHRIIMPDGRIRWQRWSDRAIFNPSGTLTEYQSVGRDITETKEAEEALRESEEKFRIIVDTTSEWIWEIDLQGRHTYSNPAVASILGYSSEEIISGDSFDLMHPEDREKVEEELRSCIRERRGWRNLVIRWRHKDNSCRYLESNSVAIFHRNGEIVGFRGADRDISERKQAEERLVAKNKEFNELLDQIQDVYYRTDNDGQLVRTSRSFADMLGYNDISEILGKNIAEEYYVNPADRKQFLEKLRQEGKVTNYEVQLKRKDGKTVLISTNSHYWFNPDNTVGGVEGTFRDITEQKKVIEALRQKTEELDYRNRVISTLLDTVPIGIFMVEATSGKPIIANREATRLLGRGVLPEASEETLSEVYEAYKAGTSLRYPTGEMPIIRGMYGESRHVDDMIVVRPDGTKAQLEVFGTPVLDKQGRVAASLVSFFDITERKQAEETIQHLAQFPEQNPNLVLRVDADGVLLYANKPGFEWLSILGQDTGQQVPASIRSLVADAMTKGVTIKREVELHDGKNRIFEVTAIRPDNENFVNIYGSDITERKRAEQAVKEANKRINLLSSITRHDVANQVSILRGYAKIALMKKPDPVVVDLLEKIDTAGSSIARQIEFTKAYQELGMHVPSWYRIREIVEQQKKDGITLSCTCDADIFADPMLEKVFLNLIDNAARHGERVTTISVSCKADTDGLVITVEDNGVGVPLDLKEKIFDKGFGKHTGFGLFLAREILAITGITIHETGMHGKGARFEIIVPKNSYRITSLA